MKLNKRGFTLIELLAVIVILVLISTMAISSISSAIERNKTKQDNVKKQVIVNYAELYYQKNKNTLSKDGKINISLLELSLEEKTDANGELITGCVTYENGANFVFSTNCL